jgi:hypothetical protein
MDRSKQTDPTPEPATTGPNPAAALKHPSTHLSQDTSANTRKSIRSDQNKAQPNKPPQPPHPKRHGNQAPPTYPFLSQIYLSMNNANRQAHLPVTRPLRRLTILGQGRRP